MDLESISSENLNKEVAYLFGVYLTDWCIDRDNKFTLQVIDKDFADFTMSCIRKINPDCKANVYERDAIKSGQWNKQKQYCVHAWFTKYKDWFESQTNKKHHIPFVIWDAPTAIKRWFIAGIMDGDGYITYHTRENWSLQWTIWIWWVEEWWIYEFKELLEKEWLEICKPQRGLTKWWTPFVRFNIKNKSFIDKWLFFTINRKQNRLKWLIERRSETKGYTPKTGEDIVQSK